MKRFVLIFITIGLLLGKNMALMCVAAEQESVETATFAEADVPALWGNVVTGFIYERFFTSFQRESYQLGELENLYEQLNQINDVLDCTVVLSDGNKVDSICTATWNTDQLTLNIPGLYDVTATLVPPDGCVFGDGVRTQIVVPIQILGTDNPIQITHIESWNPYAVAVAVMQGSLPESVTQSPLFLDYTQAGLQGKDENGSIYVVDIHWDLTPIHFDEPGLYPINGTLVPPEGTAFAEGLTLPQPTAAISVQTTEKPDLNCFYLLYPDVCFPWVTPSTGAENVTVWISEEEGQWRELTAIGQAGVEQDRIYIRMDEFTKGYSYQVQADYEGGQTGILSFLWDDRIVIDGYWEGDRDGNDNEDDTLDPPMTLPPPMPPEPLPPPAPPEPLPPAAPSETSPPSGNGYVDGSGSSDDNHRESSDVGDKMPSQPTLPTQPLFSDPQQDYTPVIKPTSKESKQSYERIDGDSMTISGARLAWLLEQNTQFVPFGWNEVSVELPAAFLKKLSLASEDMFSLTMTRGQDLTFTLSLSAKGRMVTNLESTLVRLPAPKPQHLYTLSLAGKVLDTPVSYEHGCAVFSITQTGTYQLAVEALPLSATLSSQSPEEWKDPPALPTPMADDFLPLAVTGAGMLLGGGFWLWRRR